MSGDTKAIRFTVYGKPAQMGSKKGFVVKGRAVLVDDNSKQRKNWANAVASDAYIAMSGGPIITNPVTVCMDFYFQRPKSHYRSGKNSHRLKDSAPLIHFQTPDIDKLTRCAFDAMTGIVYRDDALIWEQRSTRYWTTGQERCEIEVTTQL